MDKPTISNDSAVHQAGLTIHQYLVQAQAHIDDVFGDGYAAAHPDLVGACVQAQATDFNSTLLSVPIFETARALEDLAVEFGTFELPEE